jgi:hypothetical protein
MFRVALNLGARELFGFVALSVSLNLHAAGMATFATRSTEAQNANGCVTSTIACGGTSIGTLGVSDCTFSDGTYYDRYAFTGRAGDLVTIDVRPLSVTLTRPLIVLVPPAGDASDPPIIYGGSGTSVSYVLSSSGTWVIAVGTDDLLAAGDYFVSLQCEPDPTPALPQSCVTQTIVCGQTAEWLLGAQSCRFQGATKLYQDFEIYGVAGDSAVVTLSSNAFVPLFGVLLERTNVYLGNAVLVSNTKAQQTLTFPETGFYAVVASSRDDLKTGDFALTISCFASGCLSPLVTIQPATKTIVAAGTRATIAVVVNGSKPLSYTWFEFPGLMVGNGASLTTSPLFATTSYYATVANPCGAATTRSAEVLVLPSKRRAVSHR